MIAVISVLLALVAMAECLQQGDPCPGTCSCKIFATFHRVNCSNAYLNQLPENLHSSTTTLVFNGNRLTNLRNKTFEDYPNILQLYLDHNRISVLEVATFWSLRHLRVLFLDHNFLENIPQDAFVENIELDWLDLSGNALSIPDSGVLIRSTSVTQLILAECKLKYLPTDMFIMTLKLDKLDLGNNDIESLSLATFEHLSDLSNLNLMGNNLNCNCDIVPFHDWTERRALNVKAQCNDGLLWVKVGDQDCSNGSLYTWVGAGVGVFVSLVVFVAALTYYVCRRRKPVQRIRRPPLPSLPAGPTGEYIEVVAEKTYESIKETEVARYMTSPASGLTPPETPDGPIYVNSFVAPNAPKSRRDRVPTYDDVRPPSPTAKVTKIDAKARCMSLASILKDCDYYETVD